MARKHILVLEEMFNKMVKLKDQEIRKRLEETIAMTEGLGEMNGFTVGTAKSDDTAAVMPPSDVPPPGTVDDYNPDGEFVKVRDNSESGWAMIKRDFVDTFLSNLQR